VNEALTDFVQLITLFPANKSGPREIMALCDQHDIFDAALAAIDKQIAEAGTVPSLGTLRAQLLDRQLQMKN
jgi:hypothetical protein